MRPDAVEAVLRKGTTPLGGVRPRYGDLGLPNAMATALRALGVSPPSPPIPDPFLDPDLLRRTRSLLVLVVDGLGYRQLLAANREVGGLALLDAAKEDGAFFPITATVPSTTTAGVGSLCTARAPQEHGLVGYRLFLREYGTVANMIRFAPVEERTSAWNPSGFLSGATAFELAAEAGVRSHVVTRRWYLGSALSRMLHRGAETVGYLGASDFAVRVRERLAGRGRRLVFGYWDLVDTLAHRFGTERDEVFAEVAALDAVIDREVLRRAKGTTILLTADHGHINTFPRGRRDLRGYPGLLDLLAVPPAGEPRLVYLHAKPGEAGRLRQSAEDTLGDWARVCTAEEAFAAGLFGPGEPSPEARHRVGDVLLAPKRDRTLVYPYPGERIDMVGRHGGLSPQEMLVPLLVARL